MNSLTICTGWFSAGGNPSNTKVTPEIYLPNFLESFWAPHLFEQLRDKISSILIYQSDCPIKITPFDHVKFVPVSIEYSTRLPTQHHHNDAGATMLMGAVKALCDGTDLLYVEQDCMIINAKELVLWAQMSSAKIIYSTTPFKEDVSKGEFCLTFVQKDFLPAFIKFLIESRWFDWSESRGFPELVFEDIFKEYRVRWPFGVGRLRPIDWEANIFYFQQPSVEELEKVRSLYPWKSS